MEALRKAEEAKRQTQSPAADADPRHGAAAVWETAARDEAAVSTPSSPPSPSEPSVRPQGVRRQSKDQLAAAALFAAKQRASVPGSRLLKPLLLGLAVLVPLLGAGLWYLQQDRSIVLTPPLAQVDPTNADAGLAPLLSTALANETPPLPADHEASPPSLATPTETAPSVPEPLAEATPAAAPAPSAEATDSLAANTATTTAAEPEMQSEAVTQQPAASAAPAESSRLQVSRSGDGNTVNSSLQAAWNALQDGELEAAAVLYRNTLAERPNNRDALLGLAVIHSRNNDLNQARRLYAQVLTLNPQDPLARTGLLQTMGTNNVEVESELRKLLDSYPELAPLHFALGNFYAARQRWSEAQSAYFDALLRANRAGDGPVSPDYAFNLAISLEQLQQPRAALDYYRRAELLSRQSVPGFDPALLRSRLSYLEQNLP